MDEKHAPDGGAAFKAYLVEKLPAVERALLDNRAVMLSHDARGLSVPAADLDRYLYAPLSRFTASGGKRVRPVLTVLGAEAAGGCAEQALSCAVAIELFQSAALIHDDIADESELRRGKPCLYRTEGTGLAINAGDLALVQVVEVVLADERLPEARRLAVARELVRMMRHTLEGQALDLGWARDARWDISTADYVYMVAAKTAWYSAAIPLYAGAIAGGAKPAAAEGLLELGMHAGVAFQIQDDLLNLVGDAAAQGKDFRSDITEGKRTLAVVWALEHLGEKDRAELIAILGGKETDPSLLSRAVELIEAGGGITRCREVAEQEAAAAREAAGQLAVGGAIVPEARDLLASMAEFFISRTA